MQTSHVARGHRPDALASAHARADVWADGPRKNENLRFVFSQIYKSEMTSISYGHNEHSLLRHRIRPGLHDCSHHH